MFSIFHGKVRGLGGNDTRIWAKIGVEFRDYVNLFENSDLKVFLCIVLHADEDGWSYPSESLLMEEAGVSNETLYASLKRLKAMKINGERILLRYQPVIDGRKQRARNLIFPNAEEIRAYEGEPHTDEPGASDPGAADLGASNPCDMKKSQSEVEPVEVDPVVVAASPLRGYAETTTKTEAEGQGLGVETSVPVDGVTGEGQGQDLPPAADEEDEDGPPVRRPGESVAAFRARQGTYREARAGRADNRRAKLGGKGGWGKGGGFKERQDERYARREPRAAAPEVTWIDAVPTGLREVAGTMTRFFWERTLADGPLRLQNWQKLSDEQIGKALAAGAGKVEWDFARAVSQALDKAVARGSAAPPVKPEDRVYRRPDYKNKVWILMREREDGSRYDVGTEPMED